MAKDMTIELVTSPSNAELFQFTSSDTQYASGFYKLVYLWIKCLFTEPASNPADVDYGTAFGSLISSNVSAPDVEDFLYEAVEDASTQMRRLQSTQRLDPEERLSGTRITQLLRSSETSYNVYVEITNAAGKTLTVSIPTNLTNT